MSSKNRQVEFFEAERFDQSHANKLLADDTVFFTLKDSQREQFKRCMGFNDFHDFDEKSEVVRIINEIVDKIGEVSDPLYVVSSYTLFRSIIDSFLFVLSKKEGNDETLLFFSRTGFANWEDTTYALVAKMYLDNNTLYRKRKKPVFTYFRPVCLTRDFVSIQFYNSNGKEKFIYEATHDYNSKKLKIEGYPGRTDSLDLAAIYFENNRALDYSFKLENSYYSYETISSKVSWFDSYSLSDLRKINTKMSDSEKGLIDILLL